MPETVRESLNRARRSVLERRELLSRMEWRRSLLGMHGRSGGPIPAGAALDPMRQVDEAMDAEEDDARLLASLESEIRSACAVVAGIGAAASREASEVCERRLLLCRSWTETAREMRQTVATVRALLDMTLDWADARGAARLSEAADPAEVEAMLSRVLSDEG